jgi:hypothetical protein
MVLALMVGLFRDRAQGQGISCGFENGDFESIEEMILNTPSTASLPGEDAILIPVVFHVLHKSTEPENQGSNLSNALINQCLDKLNTNFSGSNFNIEFCLAKKDHNDQPFNGINRINASTIEGYDSFGMVPYSNEFALKTIGGVWSNLDYVNIWVVHKITSPDNLAGFAYFPTSVSEELDGIVIDYNYVNGTDPVLTHEMGHFLGLYHTFEGGTEEQCPQNVLCDSNPNNDLEEICCRTQGDKCCDTPPHKKEYGNPIGVNPCTGLAFNSEVSNFMSYYSYSGLNTFSYDHLNGCKKY